MYCPKCHAENPDNAGYCTACGSSMTDPTVSAPAPPPPRTSGLAIAALVLGILGFLSCGVLALPGLIVGIIAITSIRRSNGQLAGEGLAIAGTIASGVAAAMCLLVLPAILFPVFARAREAARTSTCMANARQVANAMQMYATDYDGRLPIGANWCDAVRPKVKSAELFECPSLPDQKSGYGYNAILSGARLNDAMASPSTVLIFESNGGWNLSGGKSSLVSQPRHGGNVFGFVDSHVAKISPENLGTVDWDVKARGFEVL